MASDFCPVPMHRSNRILLTLCIAGILLQNTKKQANRVLRRCQEQNEELADYASSYAEIIRGLDHYTALGCFECLLTSFDYFDIWKWQNIDFQGQEFTSHEQVCTFLSESHQYSR